MKLIVSGADLTDAISKVIKAASARSLNPILEGIKLKAQDNTLTLTGTDLELVIEKRIRADIMRDGETVVPAKFFADYTRRMTQGNIELSLSDSRLLTISYQDANSTIKCMNEDEYPPIKIIDNAETFSITQRDLRDLISKIVFSVANDDARPILKGCLFEIDSSSITGVALDGFRLARCVKPILKTTAQMNAIIPARSLVEMHKLLSDSDESIVIYRQRNLLMMELNDIRFISRLLDGEFINYKQIIPQEFTSEVTINKKQFEEALDRASLLSRIEKNNLVKLNIRENIMLITSESELGKIEEKLVIKLGGKDILIAFNVRYFMEALHAINDEFVKIKFIRPENPCIMTSISDASEYLYLILPIRIINR